jgi:hypothetical protein
MPRATVEVANETACRHPKERCNCDDHDFRAEREREREKNGDIKCYLKITHISILTDYVIAQEPQHLINVDLLDDVPESLDNILNGLLTDTLVAEALNARSTVR